MKRLAPCLLLAACGDLSGFSGEVPPLATITIQSTGDFEAVRAAPDANLHVALVWGTQWLPEATCFLPPESPELAAVVAAGCRNPLAFTPTRVTADAPLVPGEPASLTLFDLPSSDLMVGDVTARIAYASLVIYDDRDGDGDGVLRLARSRRLPTGGPDMGPPDPDPPPSASLVYGASFVAMTEPDTRLAFREGAFLESGFYPRHGCGTPPPAFSLLSAGGFSFADAVAATAAGTLPSEDPATCVETAPEARTVQIPLRPPAEVREVRCEQRREDSSVRYRRPPTDSIDLANLPHACASIPNLGGDPIAPEGTIQLVVASAPDDQCRALTHYTLLGCDDRSTLVCDAPEWDYRAAPPAWWPCPVQAVK